MFKTVLRLVNPYGWIPCFEGVLKLHILILHRVSSHGFAHFPDRLKDTNHSIRSFITTIAML